MNSYPIGYKYFYGCSKLKEIVIPAGLNPPLWELGCKGYTIAECTALEKITVYSNTEYVQCGPYIFYNCSSLKEINIMCIEGYETDAEGKVTGYTNPREVGFARLHEGSLAGCTSLKYVPCFPYGITFEGEPLHNCGIEILKLTIEGVWSYNNSAAAFAGMPNLKEIWIQPGGFNGMVYMMLDAQTFTKLEKDVNIYFYTMTKAEVVALCGEEWLKNADPKAHFYFKDTIPAGTEIPEDVQNDMK